MSKLKAILIQRGLSQKDLVELIELVMYMKKTA